MTVAERIEQLEAQLTSLRAIGDFTVHAFDVDSSRELVIPTTEVAEGGWSWGHCTSETCNHNSHDPRTEGPTVFVNCRPKGGGLFELPDGNLFRYVEIDHGYHYCPSRYLMYV